MYSVTKSFVAIALGFLADEGRVDLDAPICRYFPEESAKSPDDRVRQQTVRQMMCMRTAYPRGSHNWFERRCKDRVLEYFTDMTGVLYPAGTLFRYDSTGSFVLGALVERVTGMTLTAYLDMKLFKKLGIGDFTIRINNRKVLGGFFSALGLSDKIEEILRTIDKIEKIGKEKVIEELVKIGVPEESTGKIIDFITISGDRKHMIESLRALGIENETFTLGVDELETVSDAMVMFGMAEENFRIDLSIARGLDYYTGTVYETTINGHPEFGSVCSGGRYDNLTGYYTDKKLPGIGISIGLTRLFSQLRDNGLIAPKTGSIAKVLVIPMDKDVVPYAVKTANTFRANGIPADVYYGTKGMKQKMKYAARMGVAYAAIIGTDEAAAGTLALKDMNGEGGQKTVTAEEAIEILKI